MLCYCIFSLKYYDQFTNFFSFFIGLFWKVHLMDPMTYAALFTVGTLVAAYLVAYAYKNTKFTLKHKIAQKREFAIAKEVIRKFACCCGKYFL